MNSFHYLKGTAGWGLYTSLQGDVLTDIPTSHGIVELLGSGLPTDGGTAGRPWAGLSVLNDHVCVFCSLSGSRKEMMGALLSKAEFNGRDHPLLDILLRLGCAVPMSAAGAIRFPSGLVLESQTLVLAEPEPWAEVIALSELLGFIMPTQRGKSLLSACQKPLSGDWWSPFLVEKAGTADAAHLVTSYVMQNLLCDVKVQKNKMTAMECRVEGLVKGLSEVNQGLEQLKALAVKAIRHVAFFKKTVVASMLFALSGIAASILQYQKSKSLEQPAQEISNRVMAQEKTISELQGVIEGLRTKVGTVDKVDRQLIEIEHKVEKQPADFKRDFERRLSDLRSELKKQINEVVLKHIDSNPKSSAKPPGGANMESSGQVPKSPPSSIPPLPVNDSSNK